MPALPAPSGFAFRLRTGRSGVRAGQEPEAAVPASGSATPAARSARIHDLDDAQESVGAVPPSDGAAGQSLGGAHQARVDGVLL